MLSAAVTTVAATQDPILLADAKRFLRIDTDTLDHDVELLIAAARAEVESSTGLRLIAQTVEVRADCFADLEHLTVGPVASVAEIRYRDQAGTEQVLAAGSYDLVGADLDRAIVPAIGVNLPSMRAGRGAIVASLAVGYGADGSAVPPNLRWAMLALIRGKWDDRPVDIEPQIVNFRINP